MDLDGAGFATRCVHGFGGPDAATGAVVPPISLATTFAQDGVGGLRAGFEYSRSGNPTRAALEHHIAVLEGGARASRSPRASPPRTPCSGSSRPATTSSLPDDAYGGTFRLAARVVALTGVAVDTVDLTDLDAVAGGLAARDPHGLGGDAHQPVAAHRRHRCRRRRSPTAGGPTPWWWSTTPSPPRRCSGRSSSVPMSSSTRRPSTSVVTVTSSVAPWWSTTTPSPSASRFLQNAAGAVPSPFDCYLVIRGLRTLDLRMHRHSTSAAVVAACLHDHPGVVEVCFPGLPSHPGHAVAVAQMKGFGGMVSFRVAGGEAAALEVCGRTRLFTLAESLGAVESLIEHPGRMTHASVAGTTNEVPADLIRLSVGIEDPADLVEDLREALG